VKKLLASFLSLAFVTGLLCTMTGCPSDAKTKTPTPIPTPAEKTKTEKTP
jgi:hypothetical protein